MRSWHIHLEAAPGVIGMVCQQLHRLIWQQKVRRLACRMGLRRQSIPERQVDPGAAAMMARQFSNIQPMTQALSIWRQHIAPACGRYRPQSHKGICPAFINASLNCHTPLYGDCRLSLDCLLTVSCASQQWGLRSHVQEPAVFLQAFWAALLLSGTLRGSGPSCPPDMLTAAGQSFWQGALSVLLLDIQSLGE